MLKSAETDALSVYDPAPGRQLFVLDGRTLPESPSVSILSRSVPVIRSDTRLLEVFELFIADKSQLYAIPVVDDGMPKGLINRIKLVELFSRPYTRELFGRRPVSMFMDHSPIVIDHQQSVDDLARIIIDAGMQYMYDGFIITRDGRYAGMGTGHDLLNEITQRKQAHLYYLAHYDHLTGLPNRLLFGDRLEHACAQAKRKERLIALLFVDLDRFKLVNDTYGHPTGDKLLKAVADRLLGCIRSNDTVARLSGDEFTVVLEDLAYLQDAALVSQKILAELSRPFVFGEHDIFVSASIGVAMYPFDDEDIGSLVRKADAAMYHAKQTGKNNYQFYAAEMNSAVAERLTVEKHLRHALEREELHLVFQPLVELASGRVQGMEALVRWEHPELGQVQPDQFIPIAEELGLIVKIGEFVLRSACTQAKQWQNRGLSPIRVAVNLSAHQLTPGFPKLVEHILKETGLDSTYLELELTENVALKNVKETAAILRILNDMGVHLSIDDFGTGYSSLCYLKRLPFQTLKIDRAFVRDICSDSEDAAITAAMIAMAHNLDIRVIAEGVESDAQLQFLRAQGCDLAQGYLFSKPLPADDCVDACCGSLGMWEMGEVGGRPKRICWSEKPL